MFAVVAVRHARSLINKLITTKCCRCYLPLKSTLEVFRNQAGAVSTFRLLLSPAGLFAGSANVTVVGYFQMEWGRTAPLEGSLDLQNGNAILESRDGADYNNSKTLRQNWVNTNAA